MKKLKRHVLGIVDFFDRVGERQLWTYAAAATFYLFLSLIPTVVLVCAVLPYTPLTEEILLNVLDNVVPQSLYSIVRDIVRYVYEGSKAILSISAVATAWSASLAIHAVMRGMDAAYELKRKENFILFRLRACFFMVIMLAAMLLTLCAIVYGERILDFIKGKLTDTWSVELLFKTLNFGRYAALVLLLFAVFLLFFKWMPTGERALGRQWPGALFTTAAWIAFSVVFSLYNALSDKYSIYGVLGTLVVALLWVYYCMFFLLLGGCINSEAEKNRIFKADKEDKSE